MLANQRVTTDIRVRYCETDAMRIAWHGNYIAWFEIARTNWLRAQGMSYRELEDSGVYLPVLHIQCDYRQAAQYDDELAIDALLVGYTGLRITFGYEVRRTSDGAVLAAGRTEHAFTNHQMRPVRPERGLPAVHAMLLAAQSGTDA